MPGKGLLKRVVRLVLYFRKKRWVTAQFRIVNHTQQDLRTGDVLLERLKSLERLQVLRLDAFDLYDFLLLLLYLNDGLSGVNPGGEEGVKKRDHQCASRADRDKQRLRAQDFQDNAHIGLESVVRNKVFSSIHSKTTVRQR